MRTHGCTGSVKCVPVHDCDHRAAKAATGHSSAAVIAQRGLQDRYQPVDVGMADRKVIAQRMMAGVHQLAKSSNVMLPDCRYRQIDPFNLAHHVAGARVQDRIKFGQL